MVIRNRAGREIHDLEEWKMLAPPASPTHWKDGRSAKELAVAWTSGEGPAQLQALFAQSALGELRIDNAVVEAQIAFDSYSGGKRNHDLLIRGACTAGPVVIGLEAKADESFGQTVERFKRVADATRASGKTTNAPERLIDLMRDVALLELEGNPLVGGDLRYQLFTGVAGTLAAATPGEIAIFAIHEFATTQTTAKKREQNRLDIERFIGDVTGDRCPPGDNWIAGPYHAPADRWSRTPYFVAHLVSGAA